MAVAGSPIDHSLSPNLHRAAYAELGLDWSYDRVELVESELESFVGKIDASWVGLSLTMPLKVVAARLAHSVDEVTALTGACNTLLFDHDNDALVGYNTDVPALARVIFDQTQGNVVGLTILGGGATAVSAVVAAKQAGVESVKVFLRDPTKVGPLEEIGRGAGVIVTPASLAAISSDDLAGVTVSTLPGNAAALLPVVPAHSTLIDVAYAPWPSAIALQWPPDSSTVVSGLHMLARQALGQVRIFVTGSPLVALDNEEAVWAAMARSVGLEQAV